LPVPGSDGRINHRVVALGERLFFERALSRNDSLSCASCHRPAYAFAEPRSVSAGIGVHARRRNAPSLLNVGYLEQLNWDGRFPSLESQLDAVFSEDGDFGISMAEAVHRLAANYRYSREFLAAFAGPPTAARVREALASFERTLLAGDSEFDRYMFAGDSTALTDEQKLGLEVFRGRGRCEGCHAIHFPAVGANGGGTTFLASPSFHNLGVGPVGGEVADTGRFEVTRRSANWGSFRTPSLRDVARTAPYMHDGSIPSLDSVVRFYDKGGGLNPNLDRNIRPLGLTEGERRALVAFLHSLTSRPK
jgi:cytochrome c peroxidase